MNLFTLAKWYRSVNGAPGFTDEYVHAITIKVKEAESKGHKVTCNLVFDEMAIRKRIGRTGKTTMGNADIGVNINSDF